MDVSGLQDKAAYQLRRRDDMRKELTAIDQALVALLARMEGDMRLSQQYAEVWRAELNTPELRSRSSYATGRYQGYASTFETVSKYWRDLRGMQKQIALMLGSLGDSKQI
jgi:hypothetical protein